MMTGNVGTSGMYLFPAIGYQKTSITDYGSSKLSGGFESPQIRLTTGYQWVLPRAHMRFVAGGGLRLIKSSDIVIKDSSGNEIDREKSSQLGALAIDGAVGFTF